MITLGLHGAFSIRHHDASACVLIDGRPVALCEEERYLKQKGAWGRLPERSVYAALSLARVQWKEVSKVVVPGITYEGVKDRWKAYLTHLFGSCPEILVVHHQDAHAACAYYGSGWDSGMVVSIDSSGDGDCAVIARGEGGDFRVVDRVQNTQSIGAWYTAMTQACGWEDGDEYRLMGLAPYGRVQENQEFRENLSNARSPFEPGYSGSAIRLPTAEMSDACRNFAAYTQSRFERVVVDFMARWRYQCGESNLAYAGGCALNCKANRLLLDQFQGIYVSPVAGDRGLSLGCAYLGARAAGDIPRPLLNAYLGDSYTNAEIQAECRANGVDYWTCCDAPWFAAKKIAEGKVVAWFQGRSEAGARALGNRSILARADLPDMRDHVNAKIKHREEFRPFAPAVMDSEYSKFFEPGGTPYMTVAVGSSVEKLPAVTHVDGTSRVQVVRHSDNPKFYALLEEMKKQTGNGVVLNTSFNLKGQPIVESPRDALMTFYGCGLDVLIMGDVVVEK